MKFTIVLFALCSVALADVSHLYLPPHNSIESYEAPSKEYLPPVSEYYSAPSFGAPATPSHEYLPPTTSYSVPSVIDLPEPAVQQQYYQAPAPVPQQQFYQAPAPVPQQQYYQAPAPVPQQQYYQAPAPVVQQYYQPPQQQYYQAPATVSYQQTPVQHASGNLHSDGYHY